MIQGDLPALAPTSTVGRKGYGRSVLVSGATRTVRKEPFSSSGERTTPGRVLRILLPTLGSRQTR
jgi:hypothetical protein